jgi:hypothetical protein
VQGVNEDSITILFEMESDNSFSVGFLIIRPLHRGHTFKISYSVKTELRSGKKQIWGL